MADETRPMRGRAAEVFAVFLRLGLTSFGGPVAHLGYFRREFVERRRWLDEATYGEVVALCQFLPGPASSQVGFSLGLMRAGPLGALAAWCGFTLPSAILMTALALAAPGLDGPLGRALVHGLKLVAVAVVAQAVLGMARSLTPDRARAGLAVAAVALIAFAGPAVGQVGAIALGALFGAIRLRGGAPAPVASALVSPARWIGVSALGAFIALLIAGPWMASRGGAWAMFDAFYRAGALVFGGGHVVLPLLRQGVAAPGWIDGQTFLAGYGAAQAMPGPLFTFAAFLGAGLKIGPGGWAGAALALGAIFLPGMLVLLGALPFWDRLRRRPRAQGAMRGANATVVGVLAAALYDPVFTGGVTSPPDFALALAGFVLLTAYRAPPILVVALTAAASVALSLAKL